MNDRINNDYEKEYVKPWTYDPDDNELDDTEMDTSKWIGDDAEVVLV